MFIEFYFSLEMGVFFPELFHFFDDFLNFDSVLFGGDFIIDFLDLLLYVFNFFAGILEIVFLHLQFLLEL